MEEIKILLADDNQKFRHILANYLKLQKNLRVTEEAGDGWEVIHKTRLFNPDLILMDVKMPGMNGFDTFKIINELKPELPIVFLSVCDHEKYKVRSKNLGASGYIVKKDLFNDLIPMLENIFPQKFMVI